MLLPNKKSLCKWWLLRANWKAVLTGIGEAENREEMSRNVKSESPEDCKTKRLFKTFQMRPKN